MSANYEEIDFRRTPLGELLLRRRRIASQPGRDIYEIKLNDELLVSSLLFESERQLANLTLPLVSGGPFEVLVGGLGLGYTAGAALTDPRVSGVTVVEMLAEVIGWHEQGLLPLDPPLSADPRCQLHQGDFFRLLRNPAAEGLVSAGEGYGAILVDIDHAPDSWLHPHHRDFYGEAGLDQVAELIRPGGAFGYWSSGREKEGFLTVLEGAFERVSTHEIEVENPLIGELQVDTIYIATR
jgi:spermidine synthase